MGLVFGKVAKPGKMESQVPRGNTEVSDKPWVSPRGKEQPEETAGSDSPMGAENSLVRARAPLPQARCNGVLRGEAAC